MERTDLPAAFAREVVRLHAAGAHPVIIHGGGPQIDALMRRLGKTPRFVNGLRVTDDETIALVEMVLVGRINPEIVGLINRHGGHAIGLNGKDDDLIIAHRRSAELGWVGDVDIVNGAPLRLLEAHGVIPVVAPIATGPDGATYNVNADHVAGAVAGELGAAVLLQLTDVPGILDRDGHRIPAISRREVERLIGDGVIGGGMLPKVDAALNALRGGAARVRIVDGRRLHAVELALLAGESSGTEIVL
jgi:acetylglutamate kinase